jgi:hypothetical protein
MKKVINRRLYDTDTAKCVGSIDFGRPDDSLYYSWKALYVKKTGEYFLFADGGPGTQYAEAAEFTPLTLDEAMDWAEENLSGEEFEEAFGLPDEGGEDVQLNAWISATAKAKLDRERSRTGETVADVLERLIDSL